MPGMLSQCLGRRLANLPDGGIALSTIIFLTDAKKNFIRVMSINDDVGTQISGATQFRFPFSLSSLMTISHSHRMECHFICPAPVAP
jgi:hypothetical protein